MNSNNNLSNNSDDSNNCSGINLVGLSASLAILISEQFDSDDLSVLAAFVTTLGDNLALLATKK